MSRLRNFINTVGDVITAISALPVGLATVGGISKVIGSSIAQPQVANVFSKVGTVLIKGGTTLGKIYAKGVSIGAKSLATGLGKAAVKSAPVAKVLVRSIPGSKFVPAILKATPIAATTLGIVAMGRQAIKELGKVKQLTGSAMDRLKSDKPELSFQSVLDTFKNAILFK